MTLLSRSATPQRALGCGRSRREFFHSLSHYLYVELEPGADAAAVEQAISRAPLYLDEQTLVFSVDRIAALEERNRGLLLERHTAASDPSHVSLLLEARFNETKLAARMMLAAARARPFLHAGAHLLFVLPPGVLWGDPINQ